MYLNNLLLYIFIMPREFTEEQRRLLNIYMNQYAEISSQINELLTSQAEIRSMLNSILFNRNIRQSNDNRERNMYNYSREYPRPYRYLFTPLSSVGFGEYNYSDNNIYTNILNHLFNTSTGNTTSRGATSEEIENATRLVRYNQIMLPITDTCPISLERFQDNDMVRQIRYCGHIFAEQSFNQWFQTHVNCPVCRHDIRATSLSSNTTNTNANTNPNPNNSNNNNSTINNTDEEMRNENLQNVSASSNLSNVLENQNTSNTSSTPLRTNSSWLPNLSNSNINNINMVRNPRTHTIDHITFDIDNDEITNNWINYLSGIYRNRV